MTTTERRRVDALRKWATLLDAALGIPGTRLRFGLDALIGLVPGAGDAFSGMFSALLVVQAMKLGVPRIILARMALNVFIDAAVGVVPLLGDLFDVGWKANLRNVTLLERHVLQGGRASAGDYLFVVVLLALMAAAIVAPLLGLVLLLRYVGRPFV